MRTSRHWIGLVVAWLALWPGLGWGQTSTSFTFHAGATSATNGAVMSASNFSTIVVQVEGTFVGTVQFEKKTKTASGYVAVQCTNATDRTLIASSTDEPGYWECPGGAYSFRVPVTARSSGTIIVTGMGTTAVAGRSGGGGGSQGISSVMALDRTYGEAVSQATSRRDGSDAAGAYVVTFYDITNGLTQTCEVSGVLDDCNKVIPLLAGKFLQIKKAGVLKYEIDSDGNVTEGTVNCETAGVNCQLYGRLPGCGGDLVAVNASGTPDHIWTKAVGATVPTATAEVGANSTRGVATFPDADGDYGYEIACLLHDGWTGQLDAKLIIDSTGSGNVVAQIYTKCYASDAVKDAAWNAVSAHTFTLGTANEPNIYTATNVTATGCAGGNILRAKLIRNRTHASDTASAAVKVERFELWGRTIY